MSNLAVCVGLDYHKDSIQVCVVNANEDVLGNRRVVNDVIAVIGYAEGFAQVERAVVKSCPRVADFAEERVQSA